MQVVGFGQFLDIILNWSWNLETCLQNSISQKDRHIIIDTIQMYFLFQMY